MGRSKHMAPIHARMDKITAPITADVKYWFSLPSHFSLPRFVLKITLPPIPISSTVSSAMAIQRFFMSDRLLPPQASER